MNASDKTAPARRTRIRRSLVIRRSDHVGDPVGLAFLESPETNGDALLARLREYLGAKLKLIKAEVAHNEITVEVEARGFSEEGAQMAAAARELYAKGARRSALSMFHGALELDPLNAEATLQLGLALAQQNRFPDAFSVLKRARELGATGVSMYIALGQCAAAALRTQLAVAYFEEALKIEPRNFIARRVLLSLGHKPVANVKEPAVVRSNRD